MEISLSLLLAIEHLAGIRCTVHISNFFLWRGLILYFFFSLCSHRTHQNCVTWKLKKTHKKQQHQKKKGALQPHSVKAPDPIGYNGNKQETQLATATIPRASDSQQTGKLHKLVAIFHMGSLGWPSFNLTQTLLWLDKHAHLLDNTQRVRGGEGGGGVRSGLRKLDSSGLY